MRNEEQWEKELKEKAESLGQSGILILILVELTRITRALGDYFRHQTQKEN